MSQSITRRNALTTVAVLAAVPAVPVAALAATAGESRIPALFREWYRLYVETWPATDEESAMLCDRARVIENAIMAEPTETAADLAMKLLASTGNGDFIIEDDWLDREVRPLAGDLDLERKVRSRLADEIKAVTS